MSDLRALNAALSTDFSIFARKSFAILNPGTPYVENWHVDAIAHVLKETQTAGRRRQIINMPPRTLKSQVVSVAWPAFLLGCDPTLKIIVVSYSEPLAAQLSNDTRRLMQSDVYRRTFPQTQLTRHALDLLETDQGGQRLATTIGGAVTGFGADVIIVDDPHNASEAGSEIARERVGSFFTGTLSSRLNAPSKGVIVVVMQRLHTDDLVGRLLRCKGWDLLKLQARATENQNVLLGSGEVQVVRVGDLLIPGLMPETTLSEQQQLMGSAAFAAQYLQEPTPAEGAMVKRKWLQYADPPPREAGQVTLSLDTAVKTNPANDYSVCTAWLEHDAKHHLLDVWREKVDFPTLKSTLLNLRHRYAADRILVEDASSGAPLIQVLRSEGLPIIACKARESKQLRLSAASTFLESEKVIFPTNAPWLAAFETELLSYPSGRYDDQVDSLSQYLNWVASRPQPSEFSYEFLDTRPSSPEYLLSLLGRDAWR